MYPCQVDARARFGGTCHPFDMASILTIVPDRENIGEYVIDLKHVLRILQGPERVLQLRVLRWEGIAYSKAADSLNAEQEAIEGIRGGLEQFCGERGCFPSLTGPTVSCSFSGVSEHTDLEIASGVRCIPYRSPGLSKLPLVHEITNRNAERRFAGSTARERGIRTCGSGYKRRSVSVPCYDSDRTLSRTDLHHRRWTRQREKLIVFKDRYVIGQELARTAS